MKVRGIVKGAESHQNNYVNCGIYLTYFITFD